jgi:hypothetical protein
MLVRVRAERAQALPARLREMFSDRRLLWPALGASASVMLCVAAAFSVLHASMLQSPDSLARMISVIGSPGTEMRPSRPADNGVSIPRLSDGVRSEEEARVEAERAGGMLELMPQEDVLYAVRTVIGRDGGVANWELLSDNDPPSTARRAVARAAAQELALLNAVRNTRFVPAQTPMGQAVAVDVVWVLAKTTVVVGPSEPLRTRVAVERHKEGAKPSPREPAAPPVSGQPYKSRRSATA